MTTIVHEPRTGTKTRRETLLDAAALIEEHGWTWGCRGMPGGSNHTGQLCILGGIAKALGSTSGLASDYIISAQVLYGGDHDAFMAYDWNDGLNNDPLKAQKIVVRALRRLADGATWEEAIA